MEQFQENNPNPVISVGDDGIVLYSNGAGEPLLHKWGVKVGEKLSSYIGDLVQRVIFRNSPEKMEINVEKRVYLVAFYPSLENKCVNIYGFDISDQKELEGKLQESEAWEMTNLELAEIIDAQAIQFLMDDFYKLVRIPMSLVDLKGNILVGVGWQDICTKFHRVHPGACMHCLESDTKLSVGVAPGEYKIYKCKSNMWDIATPIMVGRQHVGNVFAGQFFFEDEPLDYELFRSQAIKYGFNEKEYIAALEKVPRLSKEAVNTGMSFLTKLATMISQLSYSNIKLAQSLVERDALVDALLEGRKDLDRAQAVGNLGSWRLDGCKNELTWSDETHRIFDIPKGTPLTYETFLSTIHPDDRKYVDEKWKAGLAGEPYDIEHRIIADGKIKWVREKAYIEFDNDDILLGGFGITQDITERKKAEEALRLSNIYNRSLIETSLDPLVTIGPDGKIMDVNGATEQVTGYFRNELIGTDFSDYFTEPEKARKGYQQVFAEGEVRDYPLEIQHKDGKVTPVLYHASVYRDNNGLVIGVFAAARDITERKKAEAKLKKILDNLEELVEERTADLEKAYNSLKESEKRLAEAQKMAHVGSWDQNLVTGESYWSEETYRIFGFNPQKSGASYDEFLRYIHPEDRDYVDKIIQNRLKGSSQSIDYRIILADGEERTIYDVTEIIFDEKNVPIRARGIIQDITERKKAEEKIQILANAVESSNDSIITRSLDGIITSWNKGAEKIYGYSAEEMLGKHISILEPDVLKGEIKRFSEKFKNGKTTQNYETSKLRKDGTIINVSVTLSPIFNASGELVAISTIARDITESKKAEEALIKAHASLEEKVKERTNQLEKAYSSLKESESHLAEAQKIAHIGNWDWDLVTNEIYASDETYRILGHKPQELKLTYNIFLTHVHPYDRAYVDNKIKQALKGKPFDVDFRIVSSGSEERIVNEQGEIVFDVNNNPVKIIGTIQDITERKKVGEKIKSLANVVESSNDAIITKSLDGTITSWNKGAEKIYGYLAEEILEKNVSILKPDNLKGEMKRFSEIIKQGNTIQNYETLRLKKDGTIITVSITLSPVFDTSGKLAAISNIVRDITDQKIAEKLIHEKQMAEVANRAKNEFLANMSHELRTPLNSIIGFSDMLSEQMYGELNEKQLRSVGNILKSGKHLLNLINNILDISKIEAGKMELDYKEFELASELNMIRNILSPIADKRNIEIEIDLGSKLASICADEGKFVQIIYNLVDNAIKFSYEDGVVKIEARKKGDMVEITVEDTGIGIKPEDHGKLFKPFSQIDSFLSKQSQGTGLGLSLVKEIVHLHGGYVWFKSNPGEGSTFAFAIPINNSKGNSGCVELCQNLGTFH